MKMGSRGGKQSLQSWTDMTSALGQKLWHYFAESGVPTLDQQSLPTTKDSEQ